MFVAAGGSINLFLVSRDGGYTWKEARSGMRGSSVTGVEIASDWRTSGRAWASMSDVGIQVTRDFGRTWERPTILRPIEHLAVSPVVDGKVMVFHATATELFVSEDGGVSDRKLSLPIGDAEVASLTVSPTFWRDGTVVVSTTDNRILMSTDSGATWRATRSPGRVTSVSLSPGFVRDRTMCASTWGKGVLASTDGGKTFQTLGKIGDAFVNQVTVVRNAGQLYVYAATQRDGVFVSRAGGAWKRTSLRVKLTRQTKNHHRFIRAVSDGMSAATLFCGTFEGLHISDDGGARWRKANINPTRSGRIIEMSPTYAQDRTIVAAGYGMHALISRNAGDDFSLEWDFPSWSTYSIGISTNFAKDKLVLLGMGGYLMRSTDGGKTWEWKPLPKDPDVFYRNVWSIRYAPGFGTRNQTIFALVYGGALYRSDDAGVTWSTPTRIDSSSDKVTSTAASNNFSTTALALSPAFERDQTMYVSGDGLYRSTDGGKSFEYVMPGHFKRRGVICGVDYTETGEVYCITEDQGFVRYRENGDEAIPSNEGLEGYLPSRMRLSREFATDNTIFVTTYGGGLFRSMDRGATWTRASPFPGPVDNGLSLVVSPEYATDKTIFVGAYAGFYRSRDGGATWSPVSNFEVYDDFREPWIFHGPWAQTRRDGCHNIQVNNAAATGCRAELPFEGVGVRVIGTMGPDHGILELWLDGRLLDTVDAYAKETRSGVVLFERNELAPGYHHLDITVTGRHNAKSSGARIGIDAARIQLR